MTKKEEEKNELISFNLLLMSQIDRTKKYYKFIGNNRGNYPYRKKMNTLKYNDEEFNPSEDCCEGGLYFTDIDNIIDYSNYGDTLCVIFIPDNTQVVKLRKKFKADKIYIEEMIIGSLEIIKYLISQGADKNNSMKYASKTGHLDIVKQLVEEGANVRADNNYAIRWASRNGHLDVIKYLVLQGADFRSQEEYALRYASRNGHLDVVKYLVLEKGAYIYAEFDDSIQSAYSNDHHGVVEFLALRGGRGEYSHYL